MAKDLYHEAVKTALEKDGWTITDEPLTLSVDVLLTYHIDMAAERFIVAERRRQVIVVEVKSFSGSSNTYDFHAALGQYCVYKSAMKYLDKSERLLLAVPHEVYLTFFQLAFTQQVLIDYGCEIISYDPLIQEIKYAKI